jgi:ATP-dependent DNA helicase RecG
MFGHHEMVTPHELLLILDRLLAGGENEVVEFKEARRSFDVDKIGEYVSALSNEASLRGVPSGWLVFGVSDSLQVVGSEYLAELSQRQQLKRQIQQSSGMGLTIREIYEIDRPEGRVVMLEIPAAPQGMPIAWKGDYRARAGESLVPLSLDKLDAIRQKALAVDWTAVIVPEASLSHLSADAMARARQGFSERHSSRISAEEIAAWADDVFLDKAGLTVGGQITRAALLLLGAPTSRYLLNPNPAEITWKLVGEEQAYEHFHPPFLLTASLLAKRIRNVQIRLLPPNELIYREISKYDDRSLLEALYNCIAHQDYSQNSRIIVTEYVDKVEFLSIGEFYDGTPEQYAVEERTPRKYRNPFLVEAMTQLNLIDHLGYGIRQMVRGQISRFLPLPDHDLDSQPGEVRLTIPGAVIDEAYSKLLMVRTDLPIEDVLALDRVQKGQSIPDAAISRLRKAGLIEGRKPRLHVSAVVADATQTRADYIRTRSLDDAHYTKLVEDYLERFGSATRRDIDDVLLGKLSDALSEQQKRHKVSNLLARMRRDGLIRNEGSRGYPRWIRVG